jgi:hypothetical protein
VESDLGTSLQFARIAEAQIGKDVTGTFFVGGVQFSYVASSRAYL